MEYSTKQTRRFVLKHAIDPKTLMPVVSNEKEFIKVLEVDLKQDLENREQLNQLIEMIYPEVKATIGDDKKIGIRIYTYGTVVKTLVSSLDTLEIVKRKILPSYVSEIELKHLNKKNKTPDSDIDGSCM